ncbi:DUF2793 domain-containing protein [Pikeienuella piscinae]|uniref:DUF2793 domain-containing protein n=1 Tax=Pikeienuella piscinae TaxID=2748098 RepID=A0A7L5BTS4_9RHOB|nr:DUF2793 domain-containing protein [Pikeienuella piscinae]QIE54501.1 DUF2793 domain-containing protein [Pikeienuella piscinae]
MSDTPNLSLPLLAAGQAQKHVTMNEALARLDALAAPSVISADQAAPPQSPAVDAAYIVAAPASEDWSGRENALAFRINDGWEFAEPKPGWRVWVADRGEAAVFSGLAWVVDPVGPVGMGAQMRAGMIVGDEPIQPGTGFDTALTIPDRAVVVGVTGRVIETIGGAGLGGWRLGVAGSTDRYGSFIGLEKNSSVNGVTGAPVGYFEPTPLRVEPDGGAFATGVVRMSVHYLALTPPDAV